jgi:hypothetical protein
LADFSLAFTCGDWYTGSTTCGNSSSSPGLKVFNCTPTTQTLTEIARAALDGSLRMPIGETVTLDSAINLITDLEKGRKISGKGLILMNETPPTGR